METKSFLYSLRFALDPSLDNSERIDQLLAFCKKAMIDDVAFFINCEELNKGHLTKKETLPWLKVIESVRPELRRLGISLSINPWITLLHKDRGRTMRGMPFSPMVDDQGDSAQAVVCPLCSSWREYIQEMYALYATLEPDFLWIEDDFRLHNHGTSGWGGCFCDRHMEEYAAEVGVNHLDRSEFLRAVSNPGIPHPYRKSWLKVSRRVMAEVAALIAKSVSKVSPHTKIGLMSCDPSMHCVEGRDWPELLAALSTGEPAVCRPHIPNYSEVSPQKLLWDFAGVTESYRAVLPKETDIYPEIDSFPHSTFSKSIRFLRLESLMSLFLGSRGLTFNLFDMMGNGIPDGAREYQYLAEIKPFLTEATRLLSVSGLKEQGVRILFDPNASYTVQTSESGSPISLYPHQTFWASLLSMYSVSFVYQNISEMPNEMIVAVSGQCFRGMRVPDIECLFKNNMVLLDGEAAYTLFDMGLGHLANIENATWYPLHCGQQAYEEVVDGRRYCNVKSARVSAQFATGDYLDIQYAKSPRQITVMKNAMGDIVGTGMAFATSKCIVLPFGNFSRVQSLLHPLRQSMLVTALQNGLQQENILYCVPNLPCLRVAAYNLRNRTYILIANLSGDDVMGYTIVLPQKAFAAIYKLDVKSPKPYPLTYSIDAAGIHVDDSIASMDAGLLIFEEMDFTEFHEPSA